MNTNSNETNNGNRRRGLIVVAILVLLVGGFYFVRWYSDGRWHQVTDDAYVSGNVVQITSQVPGTVISIHADDTDRTEAGAPLIELDPADAKVAMAQAEADLARSVRDVRALFTSTDQWRAQIAQRESDLKRSREDLKRREGLAADGAVSGEELSHAREQVSAMNAALAVAQQQLNGVLAQTENTSIESHPNVQRAAARIRELDLALRRTTLNAPLAGVVAKRSVQIGQRINAGQPLMAVIPLDSVWVDANFKEVQLERMRVGQPVTLHADLYGKDVEFHGKVVGLAAGTGAAFALLPAQNASGNWIKVVQRVPVRIALDPRDLKEHPLRLGLSISASVEVRDVSGPVLGSTRQAPLAELPSGDDGSAVDAHIAEIIAANRGSS